MPVDDDISSVPCAVRSIWVKVTALTVQPGSNWLSSLIDQDACIIIKLHYTSVFPL